MKKLSLLLLLSALAVSCNRSQPAQQNTPAIPSGQTQTAQNANQPDYAPAPVIDTSNWKTYSNAKYGIELTYPKDWVAKNLDVNLNSAGYPSAQPVIVIDSPEVKDNYISFDRGAELVVYYEPSLPAYISKAVQSNLGVGDVSGNFAAAGFTGSFHRGTKDESKTKYDAQIDADVSVSAYKVFPNGKVIIIDWSRANFYNDNKLTMENYLIPILESFKFNK